ncbi:NAD-dependent epimerase/dehydratase family protein [Streptomyces mangrovi]|uniref:hypothetical protein n=1 Tax=Streptomyces mangrovi TaxID=1206892 RepID=UPI00399CD6CF
MAVVPPVRAGDPAPRLLVVLGAGGRLGQVLLPRLTGTSDLTVGIGRTRPVHTPPGAHWHVLDVTDRQEADLAARSLVDVSRACEEVVVVDLLLDRSTVTAMRRTIRAAAGFTCLLGERLSGSGRRLSLVAASSTAVLAPRFLQTPYGTAKRRQLRRYASSGLPGAVLLLPRLTATANGTRETGLTWTFDQAADQLAEAVRRRHGTDRTFTVHVPEEATALVRQPTRKALGDIGEALRWGTRRLITQRESPYVHRQASHALLALAPTVLRRRIDHHGAPTNLVRGLARSSGVHVRRMTPR